MERNKKEIDAAEEYGRQHAASWPEHNLIVDAFLAGIDWLREHWRKGPDKEYYGF